MAAGCTLKNQTMSYRTLSPEQVLKCCGREGNNTFVITTATATNIPHFQILIFEKHILTFSVLFNFCHEIMPQLVLRERKKGRILVLVINFIFI
jgi:hypothetical protein